jgi:predicted ATPase
MSVAGWTFWPWIQVIGSYVREMDPAAVKSELRTGRTDVERLVPELAERWSDVPSLAPAVDADRFRLFDAVATLLKKAAATQPPVVIVNDLHWSDLPSLRLLRFLVRDLRAARLLVVATYRDVDVDRHHPPAAVFGEGGRRTVSAWSFAGCLNPMACAISL